MVVFFNNVLELVSDEATYRAVPLFSEGQLKTDDLVLEGVPYLGAIIDTPKFAY